jgi:hypothetical protein
LLTLEHARVRPHNAPTGPLPRYARAYKYKICYRPRYEQPPHPALRQQDDAVEPRARAIYDQAHVQRHRLRAGKVDWSVQSNGTAARALYRCSEQAGVVELNWTAVHEITKGATPSAAAEDGDSEPSQKHGLCLFGRVCVTRVAGQ